MIGFTALLLEMLWEKEDPAEVVASRFGFADAAAAGEWVAATVRDHWGFEVASVTQS